MLSGLWETAHQVFSTVPGQIRQKKVVLLLFQRVLCRQRSLVAECVESLDSNPGSAKYLLFSLSKLLALSVFSCFYLRKGAIITASTL